MSAEPDWPEPAGTAFSRSRRAERYLAGARLARGKEGGRVEAWVYTYTAVIVGAYFAFPAGQAVSALITAALDAAAGAVPDALAASLLLGAALLSALGLGTVVGPVRAGSATVRRRLRLPISRVLTLGPGWAGVSAAVNAFALVTAWMGMAFGSLRPASVPGMLGSTLLAAAAALTLAAVGEWGRRVPVLAGAASVVVLAGTGVLAPLFFEALARPLPWLAAAVGLGALDAWILTRIREDTVLSATDRVDRSLASVSAGRADDGARGLVPAPRGLRRTSAWDGRSRGTGWDRGGMGRAASGAGRAQGGTRRDGSALGRIPEARGSARLGIAPARAVRRTLVGLLRRPGSAAMSLGWVIAAAVLLALPSREDWASTAYALILFAASAPLFQPAREHAAVLSQGTVMPATPRGLGTMTALPALVTVLAGSAAGLIAADSARPALQAVTASVLAAVIHLVRVRMSASRTPDAARPSSRASSEASRGGSPAAAGFPTTTAGDVAAQIVLPVAVFTFLFNALVRVLPGA
ncbi:hypothetical protein [Arthrobacter sp. UM1]|uniref:hypothetical protein n=1 Tax=Arthrobacter sp. UM1 TaxID=2766776 RepID=UPI001CF69F36|nr:hypothetical protein [Arthrobacter sp. UM1]MCB4208791.1 hypothetical protein [Arthrobacter sp. UM1]